MKRSVRPRVVASCVLATSLLAGCSAFDLGGSDPENVDGRRTLEEPVPAGTSEGNGVASSGVAEAEVSRVGPARAATTTVSGPTATVTVSVSSSSAHPVPTTVAPPTTSPVVPTATMTTTTATTTQKPTTTSPRPSPTSAATGVGGG